MQQDSKNREVEFLNKVFENAQMGGESIGYLADKIEDPNMLSDLQTQHSQYSNLSSKASAQLAQYSQTPKSVSPIAQMGVWSGVKLNTLVNKSNDHIAEMMIQGSMMGVIDMSRTLREYSDIPKEAKNLGQDLIGIEENNVQRMKQYLG
ncbi:MAG: hypothetical protein EOM05_01970 [Clostridia bacterium]|nr:hypothetical protein [Clostridia bacterium]